MNPNLIFHLPETKLRKSETSYSLIIVSTKKSFFFVKRCDSLNCLVSYAVLKLLTPIYICKTLTLSISERVCVCLCVCVGAKARIV